MSLITNFDAVQNRKIGAIVRCLLAVILGSTIWGIRAFAAGATVLHTDPLNLDPIVKDGLDHFYNLDYEGALQRFEAVDRAHPRNPMAMDYILTVVIFRELYHQDLLDTTYYAHDSFLSSKRDVEVPAAIRQRVESLTDGVVAVCDQRVKANDNDKDAYFERGYAKGLHAAFITLVDHSFTSAARQGYASRSDSEHALKIDPDYADAKMAVGIQQFAVASLPRVVRMMVGIVGVGGNKEKGLELLRDAAARGVVTNISSRTVLSLFLRHDARYREAIEVQHALAAEFPHDYLFRLEEGNLTKDAGDGPGAIRIYMQVIEDAKKPGYFTDARLQMTWFGLADTQRGQNNIRGAAQDYVIASQQPNCSDWLRKRAQLNAGEMFDLLHEREQAVNFYRMAAAGGGDQSQVDMAKRYSKVPYSGR